MTTPHPPDLPRRPSVRGVLLRSILVVALVDAGRPLRVDELCRRLDQRGFTVQGRPSKVVSDALRWEVRRGRVRQRSRGRHAPGDMAKTTVWRMRQRIAAASLGKAPPHHLALPVQSRQGHEQPRSSLHWKTPANHHTND